MPSNKQQVGNWGEEHAVLWLQANGYIVLDQNYHARVGEIDIVAEYTETKRLCFIEVKTRKRRDGSAEYANSAAKQQKSRMAAMVYCQEHDIDLDQQQISFEHISIYTHDVNHRVDHYIL